MLHSSWREPKPAKPLEAGRVKKKKKRKLQKIYHCCFQPKFEAISEFPQAPGKRAQLMVFKWSSHNILWQHGILWERMQNTAAAPL